MDAIKEAVQNIAVYLLLVTIVLNLVKASNYKKYIELFTGLLLILILFTPLVRLLSGEDLLGRFFLSEQFFFESRDAAEFIYEAEADTKKELLRLYEEKVEESVRILSKKQGVEIERLEIKLEETETGFGRIEKMEIWLKEQNGQTAFKQLLTETFALEEAKIFVW